MTPAALRRTYHRRTVRRATAVLAATTALLATGLGWATNARADYVMGCERVDWGFLASGYRDICDGPRRPDGSWDRTRREWTPAHWYTPYCNYRSWYCNPAYYVEESTQRLETYPVTDATVWQGEPAWLPPGTLRIV